MMLRRVGAFGLGLLLVHVLAVTPFFLAGASWQGLLLPVTDTAIVIGVALLGFAAGWRRLLLHCAAMLLVLSMLFGALAAVWPMNYDRAFELSDIPAITGLPHLLFGLEPSLRNTLLLVVPFVVLLHLAAWFSLSALIGKGSRRSLIWWVVVLQGLVLFGVARPGFWHGSSLGGMCREVGQSLRLRISQEGDAAMLTPPPGAEEIAAAPSDLQGLDGADVHVLFIESYGRVALRQPAMQAHMRSLFSDLEAELKAAGFVARSGACYPAVSGGCSLYAHAQLFTGIPVADARTWERLMHCGVRPLPQLFLDAGYHTVESMPAMTSHWPDGAKFFGFSEQIIQPDLGYDGFSYHFGEMPDQFALHQLLREVIEPAKKPLFTTYVSVTSHLPCRHIPPYVADWGITSETFRGKPAKSHDTSWISTRDIESTLPAYRDGVAYSMRVAVGFACQLERPSMVIVLGDHQPPVKSVLMPGTVSYDVPLHILTNKPELLTALAPLGLLDGLDVPDDFEAFDSADFAPEFLRAFSRP